MIAIISGTNRNDARTRIIARTAQREFEALHATTSFLDLRLLPDGLLSPDVYGNPPEAFRENFIKPVLASDGILVVTPEYNGSFPGALKLFIDLLPFPDSFEARPVAFIGLSAGSNGALRAVEQLQMVFAYRNAYNFPRRVFIPAVHKVINDEKQLADHAIQQRIKDQARLFLDFASRLHVAP